MDQKQEENCQELMHAIEEATKKIDGELEAGYLQLEVLITAFSGYRSRSCRNVKGA